MDWQDYEHQPPTTRRQHAIRIGQVYTRTYRVPIDAADDLIPARGDLAALRDVTPTTGVLAPHVLHNPRKKAVKDGSEMVEVEITFYKAETFA